MSKPLLDIMRLNHERYGSDFDYISAMAKLSEEMVELTEANALNDVHGMVDSLSRIINHAASFTT